MIGGPTDIVVEPNILRGMPGRDQLPPRPAVASPEAQQRISPVPAEPGGWPDAEVARIEPFEHAEPQMPEPPPRPTRPAFADEVRRPAPERRMERSDPLTGFAPEPIGGRPEPSPRIPPRSEPLMPRTTRQNEAPKPPIRPAPPERPAAPPPPPSPAMSSADQNLAEMAQRLEAALRRPAGETMAPPVAPEPPASRAAPRSESVPPPGPVPSKGGFDNLEDEMASLLGRPKTPT
jgi:flagellar protein FliO/FliZ